MTIARLGALLLLVLPAGAVACSSDGQAVSARSTSGGNETPNGDGEGEGETNPPATGDAGTTPPSSNDAGTDAAPAPSTGSKGTGGPTGANTLTSAGGLQFMIDVPTATPTKPRGVLVLLHGSGASNYSTFVSMMANVATKYDFIRVSVRAPNGQGWNEGGGAAQTNAANLLHRLVQEDLFAKYDVETTRVFFSGQSSGGGFLSTHFLPLHAKDYKGGAFLQCGAAPPAVAFTPDAATKANLKLHFEITTGDTIWPQSYAQAVNAYTAAGMSLTKDNTKPGGHCQFDQQQVILDHITPMLN